MDGRDLRDPGPLMACSCRNVSLCDGLEDVPADSSFYLQVGECQKEESRSGKQGSRGRGDLWVHSQGDQGGGGGGYVWVTGKKRR